MGRADYDYHDDGEVLLILDKGTGGRSVTNDAEAVIADFAARGIDVDKRRVIYRDSTGRWDGMATRHGTFAGFIMLGVHTLPQAIAAAWVMRPQPINTH